MSINTSTQAVQPAYILGNAPTAELRLELLNELTSDPFIEAMKLLPHENMRIVLIGCGSGHLEARLSKLFTNSAFVGIDISAARLEEAKARVAELKTNNTYEFIQADLTTMSPSSIEPCDILISRFVLSHLPEPQAIFNRFFSIIKPGGYVCIEEGVSDGNEYYCNTQNSGYQTFLNLVDLQRQAQNSAFDIGFDFLSNLLANLPAKYLHCHITQPILLSARHKSIIRLGAEEAKATVLKYHDAKEVDDMISSLIEFEQDDKAFGLYMRFLAMIFQKIQTE